MTENKLQHLKDLPTPAPRGDARARALEAAMAAFDAAAPANSEPAAAAPATRADNSAISTSPLSMAGLDPAIQGHSVHPKSEEPLDGRLKGGHGESGGRAGRDRQPVAAAIAATAQVMPESVAKISEDAPKDDLASRRPNLTKPNVRRPRMQLTRFHYGMAASIAALVVAAPIAMRSMRDAQPLIVAQKEAAEAPRVAATQQRGIDETVAKPAQAPSVAAPSTPAPTAPADQDARQNAARDAVAETQRREAAQKQMAEAQQRQDAKAKDEKPKAAAGSKPSADAGSMAQAAAGADADKQAKLSGLLPHTDERIAELEATTARKGNRKTEMIVTAPDGTQLKVVPGVSEQSVAALTRGGTPPPPAAVPAAPQPFAIAPAYPGARRAEFHAGAEPAEASRNIVVPDASNAQSRFRHVGEAKMAEGKVSVGQAYVGAQTAHPFEQRTATLMPPRPDPLPMQVEQNRDQFQAAADNPVKQVAAEPVSTFSIDVDTASYSFARRALNSGRLPQKDAVRVEEMINYFPYDYTRPETADVPFQPNISVFPAPWNSAHKLVHIGLKGYELKSAERPHANIVLLIDTSGSMGPEDRLPLLKNAFRMLVDELRPDDTVSIVTYAGDTRVALEPTKVSDKSRILSAIAGLNAGGGTYGEGGIKKAYELAEASFNAKGVNRIVLGTDGDFNIGISNRDELKGYIERKREKGIFLSIVGVGRGNYNDALMQALAQNGNGTAAYVDTLSEARKVLVDEASSTLFPIAKDVKIQVEFNPAVVSEYRLIGYETRMLKREDFNNDKVDAGDVGSGHTVTAIYEVTPVSAPASVDPLRYGQSPAAAEPQRRVGIDTDSAAANELGFFKLRYKLPKEDSSRLLTLAIGPQQTKASVAEAPAEARFSTAVAAFGQLLRGSPYIGAGYGYDDVLALAQGARGEDRFGYRAEFLNLVRLAKSANR